MNYLNNIFETIKKNGFFGSLLGTSKVDKPYVSPFASRISVVHELDLLDEQIKKETQNFKVSQEQIHYLIHSDQLTTITLPFLKSVFQEVVDVEDPIVKSSLNKLRKDISKSDSLWVKTSINPCMLPEYHEQNKLYDFLVGSKLISERGKDQYGRSEFYIPDLRWMRLNQLTENAYRKVNASSSEKMNGEKLEDVLRGHYKIKNIPPIYRDMIEKNDLSWKLLSENEQSKYAKHLKMVVAEGIVQKVGGYIRINQQKVLNTWLSSLDARNYQSIKPNYEDLETNYKRDLRHRKISSDPTERKIANREFRKERRTRFDFNK